MLALNHVSTVCIQSNSCVSLSEFSHLPRIHLLERGEVRGGDSNFGKVCAL